MSDEVKKIDGATPQEDGFGLSRRQFLGGLGTMGVGAILGGMIVKAFVLPDEVIAIPASKGYLVVDTKKCGGCTSCMLACSLTHHGETNPSLSRIQIEQDSFAKFPEDISIA